MQILVASIVMFTEPSKRTSFQNSILIRLNQIRFDTLTWFCPVVIYRNESVTECIIAFTAFTAFTAFSLIVGHKDWMDLSISLKMMTSSHLRGNSVQVTLDDAIKLL